MTDDDLIAAARDAAAKSYSPYSGFPVGAALRFADGSVATGTNIENASYGLALCAETGGIEGDGRRSARRFVAVAVTDRGRADHACGRCRQVLNELAQLGGTDPDILCVGPREIRRLRLSELPHAFGPASLA